MIRVFVGTDSTIHQDAEAVLEYSIRTNTKQDVDITFMNPGWQTPPTGFSSHRYLIPQLCNFEGYAIYLDVDMLVLGDLSELMSYKKPNRWCVTDPGSNRIRDEVAIIDCSAFRDLPNEQALKQANGKNLAKSKIGNRYLVNIPADWNQGDWYTPTTKLIHYTKLSTQPWHPDPSITYGPHKCPEACDLFFEYLERAKQK